MIEYVVVAAWIGRKTEHSFAESPEEATELREAYLKRGADRVVIAEVIEG